MPHRKNDLAPSSRRSIFLVASPLQALNAIEACYAFNLNPRDALIVRFDSNSGINDRQLQRMLAGESWGETVSVPYRGATLRTWFDRMRTIDSIAALYPETDYLFVGDYGFDLARHFSNKVTAKNIIVLDDGSATLELVETRKDPGRPKYYHAPPFTTRRKLWLKRAMGMRDSALRPLTYFTVYNVIPENGSLAVSNEYARLRAIAPAAIDSESVFFLGNTGLGCSDDEYVDRVSRAMGYIGITGRRFYLPHRHENPERLKRLAAELNLSCLQFDAPIEYGLCHLTAEIPRTITGFASTAFDTLQRIFGDRLTFRVFHVEPPDSAIFRKVYEDYYRYWAQNYRAPQFEIVFNY